MNILVIDDHDEMRSMLKDALEGEGHDVQAAVHGVEAMTALAGRPVDLIISDMLMPDVDGLEFLVRVRRMHIPIIAMSGLDRDRAVSELLARLGVCAFLQKPFSLGRLVETVNRMGSSCLAEAPAAR